MSKPVSFVMSEEVKDLLKQLAELHGRSMSKQLEQLVKEAAERDLEPVKPKPKK